LLKLLAAIAHVLVACRLGFWDWGGVRAEGNGEDNDDDFEVLHFLACGDGFFESGNV